MASIVFAFGLGVFTWSLLEYGLHRFLGHDLRTRPNPFAAEHTRHHSQGDYFAPTWKKLTVAGLFTLLVAPPSIYFAGFEAGLAFATGLVGFYGFYEVLHRLEHVHAGFGAYGRWARRHHFWHHFGDPSVNHGVTSPLWDHIFGTYEEPGLILVPERLRMAWLEDPGTGELRPELAGVYQIRRSKQRA